uniref:Uncharacterized protein n=1 Tax=Lactuca sativa TaxID=4236 RepID=A0A9R1V858_LACSA|nr:hypothetical protein LSAT_V11C600310510 [Lactuca sativa]
MTRFAIMANYEESSPLLANQSLHLDANNDPQSNVTINDENNKKSTTKTPIPNSQKAAVAADTKQSSPPVASGFHHAVYGWTADGLPLTNGGANVMGEPMPRAQWDSGLFACLGRNDEFCSSDLEVCEFLFPFLIISLKNESISSRLLGSVAPCVIYGSNVERLGSTPGTFANHCLPYTGLYLIGNSFFGWNCMAPWFSYPTRTTIRRKFNLQATLISQKSCL